MDTMARITGGVDTHLEVHVAAALNDVGGVLGTASFPTTAAGYRQLLEWLSSFGQVVLVGVEGTGSYGAGLSRFLHRHDIAVVEVDRPNRQKRRLSGKSDPIDAISAARAALGGNANGAAKTRDGNVEAIRVLRVAKISAHKARTQAINQIHSLVCTAPDELRDGLRTLPTPALIEACAGLRPGAAGDVTAATKTTLRALARRVHHLDAEIAEIEALIRPIVTATAPALLAHSGVGPDTAAALLVAAGDNPERLRSEATFARLCGAAPIPATSGKTQNRHRLHRGGDRQANSALWRIALTRMSWDPDTKAYVERRTKEGLSKREVMRCLKRYIARELFADLPRELLA
ncbi:MAG: IS110 family transposase [Actinobacteria bacterium]|nr:IS110 family transposase [Actinomycetota bacterium]